jgi:hypothetical protein
MGGFKISNPNAAKLAAVKAARAGGVKPEDGAIQKWIAPADARERLRIEFDDSGSMGYQTEEAKKGVVELLRNCVPNTTAVAVHFMNTKDEQLETLSSNLIQVAELVKSKALSSGGTPLFGTLRKMVAATPSATRYVLFTDGEPTDEAQLLEWSRDGEGSRRDWKLDNLKLNADPIIKDCKEMRAPIDTVYFGSESEYTQTARDFLKYLSDQSGGYFMVFDPAKMSFAKAFKYLAPGMRLMLASESVRKEIESGKRS